MTDIKRRGGRTEENSAAASSFYNDKTGPAVFL